jgi:hypothetical protein
MPSATARSGAKAAFAYSGELGLVLGLFLRAVEVEAIGAQNGPQAEMGGLGRRQRLGEDGHLGLLRQRGGDRAARLLQRQRGQFGALAQSHHEKTAQPLDGREEQDGLPLLALEAGHLDRARDGATRRLVQRRRGTRQSLLFGQQQSHSARLGRDWLGESNIEHRLFL